MGRPYNYFQFSEIGLTGSGIVASYSGNASGFFTPIGMFSTPRGHIVPIGEYVQEFGNVPSLIAAVSGEVSSANLDSYSFSIDNISGNFYPVSTGGASLSFAVTGSIASGTIDSPTFISSYTGSLVSGIMDIPTFSTRLTGRIDRGTSDFPSYYVGMTGELLPSQGDFPTYQVSFTGKIVRIEKDNVSLFADISSISWSKGYPVVEDEEEEHSVLLASVSSIIWRVSA